MPITTGPASLPYPGPNDPPDAAGDIGRLAQSTADKLYRAFPCTSTTKPVLAEADRGFLIDVQDTGNVERWSGSAWAVLGGGGGGGGGGDTTPGYKPVEGQWVPNSQQSIPSGGQTIIRWTTEEIAPGALLTRTVAGPGHVWVLNESGTYTISCVVQFAPGNDGMRMIELRNGPQTARHIKAQDAAGDGDAMALTFSITKRFAAGADLLVVAQQSGQSNLSLQTNDSLNGQSTPGLTRLNIIKVAG